MMLIDSDADNSIIIEHNRQKKHACLKETPLKINSNNVEARKSLQNDSITDQSDETDDESDAEVPESDEPQRISLRNR